MKKDAKPPCHPDTPWFNVTAANECKGWNGWDRLATIYCVTEGSGMPIKVGMASNLKARLSTIQCATWRPVFLCWTAIGYRPHEAALKKAIRSVRLAGEWHNDPEDALKSLLNIGDSEERLILAIEKLALKNNVSYGPQKIRRMTSVRGRQIESFKHPAPEDYSGAI
jgi:hypothetical protein